MKIRVLVQELEMSLSMARVYLSGPIIHEQHREDELYRVVVNVLEEQGVAVFAPQFLPADRPRHIYQRDTQEVRRCDVLVAEVTHPSHGVGMEIMLAIELMKPVIMFKRRNSGLISCMIEGADGKAMFEYDNTDEVRRILESLDFDSLIVRQCVVCDSQVAEVIENGLRCVVCKNEFTLPL